MARLPNTFPKYGGHLKYHLELLPSEKTSDPYKKQNQSLCSASLIQPVKSHAVSFLTMQAVYRHRTNPLPAGNEAHFSINFAKIGNF